jgi:hypothetical protein
MKTGTTRRENDAKNHCLVCGEIKPLQRGLCEADYQRFRRQRDKLPADQQDAFEEMLINKGLLLPSRQGQRNVENVFADELAKFLAERGQAQGDPPPPVNSGRELLDLVEKKQEGVPTEKKPNGRAKRK